MVISWGKTRKIEFKGPDLISRWEPPHRAAVYVIMTVGTKPGYYKLLYVGESENLSERGFFRSHHAYDCWVRHTRSESKLFVGVHLMPNSTIEERGKIENQLVADYNPPCNKKGV